MYVYACMYVSVCVCMYVCMYAWMYECICIHVCTYVWMYACMHVCRHKHMNVCTYACMLVCMCVICTCIYGASSHFLLSGLAEKNAVLFVCGKRVGGYMCVFTRYLSCMLWPFRVYQHISTWKTVHATWWREPGERVHMWERMAHSAGKPMVC